MYEKRKQLAIQFLHINELMFRYKIQTHANEGINPHIGQGRVLAILKIQPEIVQKELGYLLDISKQALTELLNKLEKNGYITRTQSEKDRRTFIIKLTDAGHEAIPEKNNETNDTYITEFFDCLNDEEQTNLINYMEKIIDEIQKKIGNNMDDYVEFFRERFFAKHRDRHDGKFGDFLSLHRYHHRHHHHKSRDFRGDYNDKNDE
ncbi:MAG: MarR family transcriptional regulator [Candidatus Bathyarchaeota archaeon]|nr:MarR family transcriptional regulator [Candidatus Termiticorpusculum sp.]